MSKNEKLKIYFLILLIFSCYSILAEISLSKFPQGIFAEETYYPKEDVVVKLGKTLSFRAGSQLIFSKFHSLEVFGKLILKGTPENPIILTSDSLWNGIHIIDNGKIEFENVHIQNSVIGISIPDSQSIVILHNIHFKRCKRNLKIGERFIAVDNEKLFSIHKSKTVDNVKKESSNNNKILMTNLTKKSSGFLMFQCTSAAIAMGFLATWIHFRESAVHYNTKYKFDKTDYNFKKREQHKKISNFGLVGCVVSTTLFYTFTIRKKTSSRKK